MSFLFLGTIFSSSAWPSPDKTFVLLFCWAICASDGIGLDLTGPCQDISTAQPCAALSLPRALGSSCAKMAANELTHNQLHQRHQEIHHHLQHQLSQSPNPLTATPHDKYDDASSTFSSPTRKPLNFFDDDRDDLQAYDLEDGFTHANGKTREGYWISSKGSSWWGIKDIITVRTKKKGSLESVSVGYKDESGDLPFLPSVGTYPGRKRRRGWSNYCIFGGISGLTILFVYLSFLPLLSFPIAQQLTEDIQCDPPSSQPPPNPHDPPLVHRR